MPTRQTHTIRGMLYRDAVARACMGGAWVVELQLMQPTDITYGPRPMHGTLQMGHGVAAEQRARSTAERMRARTPVEITCEAIDVGYDDGNRPRIELNCIDRADVIGASPEASHMGGTR